MSAPTAIDLATVDPAIVAAVRAMVLAEIGAADAAISDEAIADEYRAWWHQSWGVPPNHQAIAVAVAWGRHLLSLRQRRPPEGVA